MADELLVERRGDALWLTMNRPERRNAINPALLGAFESVLAAIPDGVRAVVLTGAGSSFCAGADLEWMAAQAMSDVEATAGSRRVSALFAAYDALPVPLVARINGPAVGGGVGLAAIADVAVAAEGATFHLAEVLVGLVPAMISPYVTRRVGPGRAREWVLTAERLDAGTALSWGLVGAVVPPEKLDETVEQRLALLRRGAPGALAAAKAFMRRVEGLAPPAVAEEAIRVISERRTTAEARERAAAFLAGRKKT
ncbi:MAG: enoyl-CoA hydratase-related protein [Myxococcota bacterium]|nr:enoyl-CoA hydratase-related protein [Myxococcota bacterium]